MQQRLALRDADPEERVAAVMAAHGRTLLRIANHWSLCHDDALDAYQRGLEIFLKRAHAVDPSTEVAWLKVVIKHEALAIRRTRSDSVGGEEPQLDAHAPAAQRSVEEQIASGERVSRSAEALRALKPDEARALMLKAEGLSYQEIGERCGWTYTKVNRAITEGRRRFMKVYAAIEAGDECDRFAPILAALASGTATSAQVVEIRPHLRHCMACRATMRELRLSRRRRVQLWLPLPLFAFAGGGVKSPEELLREEPPIHIPGADTEPVVVPEILDLGGQLTLPLDAPPLPDLSAPVAPPAPPPEPAADVAGQLTLPLTEHGSRLGPGRIRDELLALFNRTSSSDVATGIHILSTGGGGRISTIAAIIGFCVSGAGAGALCVATGVVKGPEFILGEPPKRDGAASKGSGDREARDRDRDRRLNRSEQRPTTTAQSRPSQPPARARKRAPSGAPSGPRADRRLRPSTSEAVQQDEFGFERGSDVAADPHLTTPPPPITGHAAPRQDQNYDPAQEEFGP
jgi:RNA polymerase sigma factor (sigma-70 family)